MSTITVPRCISGERANASERTQAVWNGAVLAQRNGDAAWYRPGRAVDVTGRSR